MSDGSPRIRTLDEIEAREARKRESFAALALIAPTPEMIREVLALSQRATDVSDGRGYAVIDIEPDREAVRAGR